MVPSNERMSWVIDKMVMKVLNVMMIVSIIIVQVVVLAINNPSFSSISSHHSPPHTTSTIPPPVLPSLFAQNDARFRKNRPWDNNRDPVVALARAIKKTCRRKCNRKVKASDPKSTFNDFKIGYDSCIAEELLKRPGDIILEKILRPELKKLVICKVRFSFY